MKKLIPVALLLVLILVLIFGQFFLESYVWEKSQQRLEDLNDKITLLEEAFQKNPQKPDSLAIPKLALEISKLDQKVKEFDDALRTDFFWLVRFGIPATLVGAAVLFWSIYTSAHSLALNEAKKKIEKLFKSEEQLIREEKKILVIHYTGADRIGIQQYFSASKFDQVEHTSTNEDELNKFNFKDYDLLMFNNKDKEECFTEDEIEGFIKQARLNAVFFYYRGGTLITLQNNERVNSANFKSQIVPNIINLLKFQDLSKRQS